MKKSENTKWRQGQVGPSPFVQRLVEKRRRFSSCVFYLNRQAYITNLYKWENIYMGLFIIVKPKFFIFLLFGGMAQKGEEEVVLLYLVKILKKSFSLFITLIMISNFYVV